MGKTIKLTESQLKSLVNQLTEEEQSNEGVFDKIGDAYRGLKGIRKGFGYDYILNMSRLQRLIMKLKKLDQPNLSVMKELESLKTKVTSLNIPQLRKDALIGLIDNSLVHFNKYNSINDQILSQIKNLNLDSWK
jgi:uncharacterized protein (UPF0335 family)